jgi:hypothetical protein
MFLSLFSCIPFGAINEKDGNTALWSPKGVYSTSYTNIKIPSYTGYFTGTSASSPMAFGCIGLVIGELKERGLKGYTREQAKKHIRMVSKDMYDKGYDNKSGYGLYRLPKVYELSYEDEAKGYGSAYFDYRQWR